MVMEEQQSDMELASERVPVPQVQKVEESRVEPTSKVTSFSRGKPRLRKKALHAAILKQMEFYFSDANLSKDRFLRDLVEENPYVDLNVFIKFNRIRDLSTDTNRIAKALQGSDILQLSEDGTKVRRVTPVAEKKNIDDCTIYVQNLPPDADHELISTIFSQYGNVVYVSVPRYKSNKKIKGFAFVEFDKPKYAEKCLKSFKKKGCVLPSNTSPDDLLSITTFDNSEKDVTQCGRSVHLDKDNVCNPPIQTENWQNDEQAKVNEDTITRKETENCVSDVNHKKRTYEDAVQTGNDDADESNEPAAKKRPTNQDQSDHDKECEPPIDDEHRKQVSSEQKPTKCRPSEESGQEDNMEVIDDGNEEQEKNAGKKKKRKRNRRSKMEDETYTTGLQVMPKKSWKALRNKYLTLQRSKMKQLKQHLRKARWNQWSNYEKNKVEKEDHEEKDKAVKREQVNNCRYTFTPGVIVKIDLDKPCSDPKSFKMELRGNSSVKYIDVEEGSYNAYIRCDSAEAAQLFVQKSTEEKQISVLQGEEEHVYWDKIAQDREEKLGKKVRVKQRGRDKLLKKAEKELGKHIKFDEV